MSDYSYENMRRVSYGSAVFVPVCEQCLKFVKADDEIAVSDEVGLSPEPNATCKNCGRTRMLFEGFV